MKENLLEFDKLVLKAIVLLGEDAYSISIKDHLEELTKRRISALKIHSTLNLLERNGYIKSKMGKATQVRGGRAKRIFKVAS